MRHLEQQNNQCYEFGPYRLATAEHRLYRHGEVVMLPPKEFDLLLLLAQNSGHVMDRESLIKALWPNTVVEEANLNVHISALRKALAESPGEQRYIETLPRLGYRFIAPVGEVNEPETAAAPQLLLPLLGLSENGVQNSNQNGALIVNHQEAAPDWYSRHRLAAVTLPLWLLSVALLGILAFLFFRSFWLMPTDSSAGSPM